MLSKIHFALNVDSDVFPTGPLGTHIYHGYMEIIECHKIIVKYVYTNNVLICAPNATLNINVMHNHSRAHTHVNSHLEVFIRILTLFLFY